MYVHKVKYAEFRDFVEKKLKMTLIGIKQIPGGDVLVQIIGPRNHQYLLKCSDFDITTDSKKYDKEVFAEIRQKYLRFMANKFKDQGYRTSLKKYQLSQKAKEQLCK